MKQLTIPYLQALDTATAKQADNILKELSDVHTIDTVNWPNEFAYKPSTKFKLARSKDALFIRFCVNGQDIKAVYTADQDPVHEDSCVEFFCMPEGADGYTNFEFNAIGTCSASNRKGRSEGVVPFNSEEMKTIERFASLGNQAIELQGGEHSWQLTVKIPFKLMNIDGDNLPEKIRGNFYKCGDLTHHVHFVSWSSIKTEQPNFHCPEFFGELVF